MAEDAPEDLSFRSKDIATGAALRTAPGAKAADASATADDLQQKETSAGHDADSIRDAAKKAAALHDQDKDKGGGSGA